MGIKLLTGDFRQAKAILCDTMFEATADRKEKNAVAVLKLFAARKANIDFELELAKRICGDNPKYPYRSSYYLTKFFQDLGFDYTHDGSTRRNWVRDVLLQLDVSEISVLVKKGLFRRKDFSNQQFRKPYNAQISDDDFLDSAILDFRSFIDKSIREEETVDLDQLLGLNLNTELLFENDARTSDEELNRLVGEAKERYLKLNDQDVALEKLWDAFERIKTYFGSNKKESADRLVAQISVDIDRDVFADEFKQLTKIGNEYRIRHHETDKKPISNAGQISYLFFRMLSLISLCLEVLRESDDQFEL